MEAHAHFLSALSKTRPSAPMETTACVRECVGGVGGGRVWCVCFFGAVLTGSPRNTTTWRVHRFLTNPHNIQLGEHDTRLQDQSFNPHQNGSQLLGACASLPPPCHMFLRHLLYSGLNKSCPRRRGIWVFLSWGNQKEDHHFGGSPKNDRTFWR